MATRLEPPPCDTVYFGQLPEGTSEDSLVDFLQNTYGAKILWKRFFQDRAGTCAALVQFDSVEKAVEIKDALHMTTPEGATQPVMIRFKDVSKGGDGGGSTPVATDNDNLYMQNLPLNADAQMYEMWFGELGTITSFKILDSGTAGLFRFASPEEAQNVINVMNGKQLPGAYAPLVIRPADKKTPFGYGKGGGKPPESSAMPNMTGPYSTGGFAPQGMSSTPAVTDNDNDNVYMANLPPNSDAQMFENWFGEFGTIVSFKILPSGTAGLFRFASPQEAKNVIRNMKGKQLPGAFCPLTIRLAEKKIPFDYGKGDGKAPFESSAVPDMTGLYSSNGVGLQGMASTPAVSDNDNLYMQNLPPNADAQMYQMWFGELGTITSFKILESGTAGLFRFASPEEAQNVISVMNGKQLPGAYAPLVIRPAEKKTPYGYGKGEGKAPSESSAVSGPYSSGGVVPGRMSSANVLKSLIAQNVILDPIKFENDCYVVYVCGLPVDIDEPLLYKMFAPFGSILSVCLQKKTSWSTGADFVIAFVNFGDLQGAENAINTYNQLQLPNGSYLKVTHKPPKADSKGKGNA